MNEHIPIQHFVNMLKTIYCALQLGICMYINLPIYEDRDKSRCRNHYADPCAVCWRTEILTSHWSGYGRIVLTLGSGMLR